MVISPLMLWKEFDRQLMPLDPSIISVTQTPAYTQKLVYFNGLSSAENITRIFARLVIPTKPLTDGKGVIMVVPDANSDVLSVNIDNIINTGLSALVVDWAGNFSDRTRFTLYPKVLSFANYNKIDSISKIPSNPKLSCWYLWATTVLRAITFLESEGYEKKGLVGIGQGGASVFKAAAYDNSITAAAVILESGLERLNHSGDNASDLLSYKASLDTANYAPLLKCPMFMVTASNDSSGRFDYNLEVKAAVTRDDCFLLTLPLIDPSLNGTVYNNLKLFFGFYFCGKGNPPHAATIKTSKSEKSLYYQIFTFSSDIVKKIDLYIAYQSGSSIFRYWRCVTPELISETEFIRKVPVYIASDNVLAFCNITYDSGFISSTPLISTLPSSLGVETSPITRKRLIYDSDMGTDDFILLSSTSSLLKVEEGAYNISGMALPNGCLLTYKLGDILFKGGRDSILQLIISSKYSQILEFSVIDSKTMKEYFISKSISPDDEWLKISLSATEFKCDIGSLESYESVAIFKIRSKHKILINSMLWV